MSDPAKTIRSAFPYWRTDPYQKAAADALLRILFAGEAVERELQALEEQIAFFISDPPTSLLWKAPANRAEVTAKKLEVLASEIRKGVTRLRWLEGYEVMFGGEREAPAA